MITDRAKQRERWVEHDSDSELYSRQNTVSEKKTVSEPALNAIEGLQTMDELDDEPTLEALAALAAGKPPGKDGIPSGVIKCAKATLLHGCM